MKRVVILIQIKSLEITNRMDLRLLVSDISFVLNEGDKVAIIGEEGNGKSTLLKLIYDEKMVNDYVEYTGEIIKGTSVIGYLPQELGGSEGNISVYEYLMQEENFLEMNSKDMSQIARYVGVPFELLYSEEKFSELSGGEKIKIQFVRILCKKPDVLFLDEPSNDIDIGAIEWLEEFISNWHGAVLYISHDEMLLQRTANMIIHLEQVKKKHMPRNVVWRGGYLEYVERRKNFLTKQEQLARKEQSEYQSQFTKFRQIKQKVEYQQEIITRQDPRGAALLKKKMHSIKALERRLEKTRSELTEIPDVEEAVYLSCTPLNKIPNGKKVLDIHLPELKVGTTVLAKNINMYLEGNQKVCIIGSNGCGKTTLLKKIKAQLAERNEFEVAYMPQNYDEELELNKSAVEYLCKNGDKEEKTQIYTYLGALKFTKNEMERRISELSGGQKAKIFLAKISLSGANVMLLDEPTRNISPLTREVICELLAGFEGVIISVSHDRKYVSRVADIIYSLDGGWKRIT